MTNEYKEWLQEQMIKLPSYQKDLIAKFEAAPKGSRLAIVRPRNLRLIKQKSK